jgi:hypothetical protein
MGIAIPAALLAVVGAMAVLGYWTGRRLPPTRGKALATSIVASLAAVATIHLVGARVGVFSWVPALALLAYGVSAEIGAATQR